MLVLTLVIIWIVVAFLIGVRVGQFLDKPVPTPIRDTHTYLSMVEKSLIEKARSDQKEKFEKQPE